MKKITALLFVLILSCGLINVSAAEVGKDFTCKSAVLMEASTGKVIYAKKKDEQLSIASITKLMPLLITMEKIEKGEMSLTDTVTGTKEAREVGGSTMFLDTGEKMSLDDIIKGICVNSANDGAVALAQHISKTQNDFVKLMNDRAVQLGLKNTHYVNVMGFDANGHYSSAYDVALLSREIILNHPKILEYSQIKEDYIRGGKTQLLNTNKLLSTYEYTTGLKTGTETDAKYCVSATAEKDGMKLIAVVLGAESSSARFEEAKELLEYGYSEYSLKRAAKKNESFGKIGVIKGAEEKINAVTAKELQVVIKNSEADGIKKEAKIFDDITAPVKKGTKVGTLKIKSGKEVLLECDLTAEKDVGKISFFGALAKVIKSVFKFN